MTAPAQAVKSRMRARGSSACGRGDVPLSSRTAQGGDPGRPDARSRTGSATSGCGVRLPGVTHLAFGHVCLTLDDDKAAVEGAHRSGRPPQQSEIR